MNNLLSNCFYIISIISALVFIFIYYNDGLNYIKIGNSQYKIRTRDRTEQEKEHFGQMLDTLYDKSKKLVISCKQNNYPDKVRADRLYERFQGIQIKETSPNEKSAAYTINKGDISICLEKNGKPNDINVCFFVTIHELAHIMSESIGHGPEFKENFTYLLKQAVRENLYIPDNFAKKNYDFCGVNITSSPCNYGKCDNLAQESLESFYQETLLNI